MGKHHIRAVAGASTLTIFLGLVSAAIAAAPGAVAIPPCNGESLNGGGSICLDYDPHGYNALLVQGASSHYDYMDFNLNCASGRWFGDLGAFVASPGNHSYVFSVGSQGTCWVTVYDRSAGGQASSPSVTR
jgi:hypothetical protein